MSEDKPFIRADVAPFLESLANQRDAFGPVSIESMRAAMQATGKFGDADPRSLGTIEDMKVPGADGEIRARFYDLRMSREAGPLVLFMHGGGFVAGDLETHHNLCTEIAAELDLPVLALDYRLGPEKPFPAAPDDCEAAARWIAEQGTVQGRAITSLVPMGDSAGGNLTIITTQALMAKPAALPVIAQVPFYPTAGDVQATKSYEQFCRGYLLELDTMILFSEGYAASLDDAKYNPFLSPLAGLPPTLLTTASLDPLRDGGRTLAGQMIEAGVDVHYIESRGLMHGFLNCRKVVPSAEEETKDLLAAAKLLITRADK